VRVSLKGLVVPAVALLFASCADAPIAPTLSQVSASATAGCTATLASLKTQARSLFGASASNVNSVRGKLDNMDQFLRKGKTADAQRRAHDIVDFTLAQHEEGRISGTDAEVTAFINGVYCYAGIDISIEDPDDTWFILPSDQPQVLYGLDSTAGVSLPANPVGEPSLLRIERFEGQLNTKLDQYPGYVRITLLNDGNTALVGRATITVCATGLPADLDPTNLRLGHGIRDTGFVITPQPTSADPTPASVACGPTTGSSLAARVMNAVRNVFAPKTLDAVQDSDPISFGGGVSGTVTEFSPFAPVDAELSFGGGVSGTVTEFSREAVASALMFSTETLAPDCSIGTVHSSVVAACQPIVSITTKRGTVLEQVPVDWFVRSDDKGRIAARSGNPSSISCGAFGTTASTTTSANGNAGVCWILGNAGANRVVAKARSGGDAPAGVWFSNASADSVVFDVNALAPAGKPTQLLQVSGDAQSAPAASSLAAPLRVRVLDDYGTPVANANVYWLVMGGSGALSAASATTDASGYASVTYAPSLGANEVKAYINDYYFKFVYFTATGTAP
jgi:hypothetical protein